MTLVGKIMAFFVLIACLAAGGLMIMVYTTRVNWADGHKKAVERLAAVEKDRDQYAEESRKIRQDRDAQILKLNEEKKALVDQIDKVNKAAEVLKKEKADLEATNQTLSAAVGKNQASSNSRGTEVATLQKQVEDVNEELRKQIVALETERDERVRAEIERKTYQARNLELEGQLREMAKDLARSRNGGTGGTSTASRKPGQANPPLDAVEGRISYLDPSSNLITLSIGSDAGLAEGHTLEVFRLGANPKYLGTVEILSVKPHQAVARPSRRGMAPLQVNDRVASKIQVGG